jgi:HAD superfamily hydrolase (TIGR01509 family)
MRAVVFDFDGVLVDSEPLHYRALRECLVPCGITIDQDEYYRFYLAYDDRESIRIALERHGEAYDGDRVDEAARRKAALYESLLAEVPFFPGARDLVSALAKEVPLGIASGARRAEIEGILSAAGLRGAFAAVIGADDVSRTKPHPEPYLAALARLARLAPGLAPAECLVVEDSMPGIAAGLAAGMKVLAVSHTYPAEKLRSAHRVVGTLRGLDPSSLHTLFAA